LEDSISQSRENGPRLDPDCGQTGVPWKSETLDFTWMDGELEEEIASAKLRLRKRQDAMVRPLVAPTPLPYPKPARCTHLLITTPTHVCSVSRSLLPHFSYLPHVPLTLPPLYQQAQAAERLQHMQAQYLVAPASNGGSPNRRRDPRPHPQHPHQQHGTNSGSAPSPSKTSAYLSRARDIRSGKATVGSPGASIAGKHGSDRRASSPSSSSTRDRGAPLSLVARARLAQKRSAALKGKFRCVVLWCVVYQTTTTGGGGAV
jgi:hypothetical protein